jgi:hypothetical protein
MDLRRFLLSGILGGIAIWIVGIILSIIVMQIWPFDVLSLGGMRTIGDPIILLYFLQPFVLAFALSYIYPMLEKNFKGSYIDKGKSFGIAMWIVVSIPHAFLLYSSMNYPIGFTVESVVGSLLYMIAAGIVIARINKR